MVILDEEVVVSAVGKCYVVHLGSMGVSPEREQECKRENAYSRG